MKIYKNRIVIIALCLILAGLFMFLYSKSFKSQTKTIEVVKVSSDIKKGALITKDMITVQKVGEFNLSSKVIKNKQKAIDTYALADFSKDDLILSDKIANVLPLGNQKLESLDGSKLAMSISIKNFANGLSDKLQPGDIVSCIVTKDDGAVIPPELTYVEILTTTYITGQDKEPNGTEQENIATVTLLVSPVQAELLAKHNQSSSIHLALAYRGELKQAEVFLSKQSEVLSNVKNNSNNGQ